MTKLARALALMTALAVLTGGTLTLAAAQDKGKAAQKDTKKKDDKKADKAGTVEIYKGKNGYRYRVKNADGKTIAMPLPQMAWETKKECEAAIDDLKATLEKGKVVDVKE
jgi:uncharacterized protein YegP (UPF0339 family)